MANTNGAYQTVIRNAFPEYEDMVGCEQAWEMGGRSDESALFKALTARGRVLSMCETIAKAFSMCPEDVYDDVERAYTGC